MAQGSPTPGSRLDWLRRRRWTYVQRVRLAPKRKEPRCPCRIRVERKNQIRRWSRTRRRSQLPANPARCRRNQERPQTRQQCRKSPISLRRSLLRSQATPRCVVGEDFRGPWRSAACGIDSALRESGPPPETPFPRPPSYPEKAALPFASGVGRLPDTGQWPNEERHRVRRRSWSEKRGQSGRGNPRR
jgi:hypothetical protein